MPRTKTSKPKTTFLLFLALTDQHVTLMNCPYSKRRGAASQFTSRVLAEKYARSIARNWKKGWKSANDIKVGVIPVQGELPPFLGTWATLKKHGIQEIAV